MNPETILNSSPLDFEIAELVGEKPCDFLVLCFDGVVFEKFGTPYDTPYRREVWNLLISGLNSRKKKSDWPDFFQNWKRELIAQYGLPEMVAASDDRPVASYKISRVCYGYSRHIQCAFGLIEKLGSRVASWSIGRDIYGVDRASIHSSSGESYNASGIGSALVLTLAAQRLLIIEGMPIETPQTNGH
jgi:hypothetical protein